MLFTFIIYVDFKNPFCCYSLVVQMTSRMNIVYKESIAYTAIFNSPFYTKISDEIILQKIFLSSVKLNKKMRVVCFNNEILKY